MSGPLVGSVSPAATSLAHSALDSAMRAIQGYVVEPMLWSSTALVDGLDRMAGLLARDMPEAADVRPRVDERVVTLLFTDISGFTALAEHLSAAETASFLARHVRLVARCVAAENGTFDKFVGDAVMAYWGAPRRQPDHAARALRAAHAVAAAVRTANGERRREGLTPIRLRLGLHAGTVAIGDIGAPAAGTALFGDTVNTGQRIEELAKEYFSDEDDVVGLASAAMLRMAGLRMPESGLRWHHLRGRSSEIAVSRFI